MSKERHLIPCAVSKKGTLAKATAELVIQHVVKLHRLPDTVVSDHRPQFVAEFQRHLCWILQIEVKLSTAFYPKTDRQTKAKNKEIEHYLQTYVDYLQENQVKWLALAEFAANNAPSATTTVSLFYANKGYYS